MWSVIEKMFCFICVSGQLVTKPEGGWRDGGKEPHVPCEGPSRIANRIILNAALSPQASPRRLRSLDMPGNWDARMFCWDLVTFCGLIFDVSRIVSPRICTDSFSFRLREEILFFLADKFNLTVCNNCSYLKLKRIKPWPRCGFLSFF